MTKNLFILKDNFTEKSPRTLYYATLQFDRNLDRTKIVIFYYQNINIKYEAYVMM